jgi:hypothetical protein
MTCRIRFGRNHIWLVIAVLAAMSAGCSADSQQASASPTTSSSAPTPEFPDMTSFAAVDPNAYVRSQPYFNGIMFRTPDGISCDRNAMNSLNNPDVVVLTCVGPRPDQGPGFWKARVTTGSTATIEQTSSQSEGDPGLELPTRHTISYDGILCGTDNGTTACRIGDHGFVLAPDKTTLF